MPEFLIHLRHVPGPRDAVPAELRLRTALKRLLRDHKLKAVDVKVTTTSKSQGESR